jgi:predicted PurR-regulated permease PerM
MTGAGERDTGRRPAGIGDGSNRRRSRRAARSRAATGTGDASRGADGYAQHVGASGELYLLWELRNIVVWCVVAMFLAVALNPAVDWLDRRGLPRVVAIVLVYLALLFLVVGTTALLLPPLISQSQALVTFVIDLVRDPPGGTPQAALQDLADSYGLGGYLNDYLDTLRDQIGSLPERLSAAVAPLVSVTRSIIGGVVSLISVLLLTFFLLLDGRRFVETGLLLVKPSRQPRIRRLLDRSAQAGSGYITGNLAISLIAGVATYIALVLLGVPYALTLASST